MRESKTDGCYANKHHGQKSAFGNDRFRNITTGVKEIDGTAAIEDHKDKACNRGNEEQGWLWGQRQRDPDPDKGN